MNRLVIIGNGFDLSHGLKTSYEDFLVSYLQNAFSIANKKGSYDDENIQLKISSIILDGFGNLQEFIEFQIRNKNNFAVNFKNIFLHDLIKNVNLKNWVDIEQFYYELLLSHINNEDNKIKKLNYDFQLLKIELEKYLAYVLDTPIIPTVFEYINIFKRPLDSGDFPTNLIKRRTEGNAQLPDKIRFLNFNYTNLLNYYSNWFLPDSKIINIHGQINSNKNRLIFGFGDDVDDQYSEIENKNENYLFHHLKAFQYLESSNYNELIKFLSEEGNYEVFVIGHSCGLSDRTMLNYIFQNEKCKSVRIFYYKDIDGFRNSTYQISRHFKDKSSMRIKIVPFDRSYPCPQEGDQERMENLKSYMPRT